MNISVRGKHLEVTDALRDYAEKRIMRLGSHFIAPDKQEAHVVLSVEGTTHRAEVSIQVLGFVIRAEATSQSMYSSIDLVTDKLNHQLQKRKDRIYHHHRRRGEEFSHVQPFRSGFETIDAAEEQIVKTKKFNMKPMDVQEAILQMELLGHDFFVFTNSEDDEVNVLYRRNSGNYGLITKD